MTSPNIKLARWLPNQAPNLGDNVVVTDPSGSYETQYAPPGSGGAAALPTATAEGQAMISGPGPNFPWTAKNIDGSRY